MNEPQNHNDRELELRLAEERPIPNAGFRARLRAELLSAHRTHQARPRRLRLLIGTYAAAGALLLLVAAVGVAGAGPLGA